MPTFFDYFQIASVLITVIVIAAKVSYLFWFRGINPIAIGGGKKGFLLAVELIAITGLLVWLIEILLYALHADFRIFPAPLDRVLIDSPIARIIGVILITIGLGLFVLAYLSFGDSWRVGFDVKSPGALVTNGVFAVSRNPIYLFLDLWFAGTFLINGTLIFLFFAIAAIAIQHWQIRQEESFLLQLYGQTYQNYCKRTGRYFVW
jgi:protein-S-isoprenylcysteine O-methyltransferase Ste14